MGEAKMTGIQSRLPNTLAGLMAQDINVSANQMQRDSVSLSEFMANQVDADGAMLHPSLSGDEIEFLVPQCLKWIARRAFLTASEIGAAKYSEGEVGRKLCKAITVVPDHESGSPTAYRVRFHGYEYSVG